MAIKVREIIEKTPEVIRVERDFAISPAELWAWVTRPELTDRWFGPWQWIGEDEIEIVLKREEGAPAYPARVLEVNETRGYTLLVGENTTNWLLLVSVEELSESMARFSLIHPWEGEEHRKEIQAGWEYYADCLKSAITGSPEPKFTDYL